MRRLLPAIAATGLCLALASPAFASDRVPTGVKRISVTLSDPQVGGSTHKTLRRTLTKAAAVRQVVDAADVLKTATMHGVCPMFVRVGPKLTVVFKGSSGQILAQSQVEVAYGSGGSSGTSYCFPIDFTAGGKASRLLGNSYVRLVGRLIGTAIS